MTTQHFRLIFQRIIAGTRMSRVISHLREGLTLPEERVRVILTSPPRVLRTYASQHDAEQAQMELEKLGVLSEVDPVTLHPDLPFAVPRGFETVLRREISRVLRCKTSLALFLVSVLPHDSSRITPSFLGNFRRDIAESFRESDAVEGIDETTMVLVGFCTDLTGSVVVREKLIRVIRDAFGDDMPLSVGTVLFPDDARTIWDLMRVAADNRVGVTPMASALRMAGEGNPASEGPPLVQEKKRSFCEYFENIRGQIFYRLLNMPPESIWVGLSHLTPMKRDRFLDRLPHDSPLLDPLRRMVGAGKAAETNPNARRHFEAIMHQMSLEEGLVSRERLEKEVRAILDRGEDLPTLPVVAMKVFRLATEEDTSADQLSEVVSTDPALTSKLLKTVNSAFYGNQQKIENIRHALTILGTTELVDIAFGLATAKVFQVKSGKGFINPEILWRHSVRTAVIAQYLGAKARMGESAGIFTAGLLHDVGIIFGLDHFEQVYERIYQLQSQRHLPLFDLEEEQFGFNHATIGLHLARNWNLPQSLVEAIAYHHQPYEAPEYAKLAALVGLADYLDLRVNGIQERDRADLLRETLPWLTYGHWRILKDVFPALSVEWLDDMTEEARTVIEARNSLITGLG